MCWRVGSVEDVVATCSLCKLFSNKGKCPHERQVCSDRNNHPNFDVRHFVNSECRFANNCGYCKMARANPTADLKHNRGWPGCCRPPHSHEWDMVKDINVASMIAVLHDVPIPTETKKRLEANASPKPTQRPPAQVQVERDREPIDLERRGTIRAPPGAAPGPGFGATPAATSRPQAPRRTTADTSVPSKKSAMGLQLMASLSLAPAPRATALSSSTLSNNSSDSASNHGGAFSDSDSSTVRSEFTDYLSEESEAELQRQALLRAELKKEEDEFKAARAKLVGIDTTNPPVEWSRSGGQSATRNPLGPANQFLKGGPQGRNNPVLAPRKASPPTTGATAPPRASASVADIQRALAAANRPPPQSTGQRQQQRV